LSEIVSFPIHVSQRHVSFTDAVMSLTVLVGANRVCCLYTSESRVKYGQK